MQSVRGTYSLGLVYPELDPAYSFSRSGKMKNAWSSTFIPSQVVVLNTGIILHYSNLTQSQVSIYLLEM